MSLELTGKDGFTPPFGGSLYGPPPYEYRKAQQSWITYEAANLDAVRSMLPPGVEPDADIPVCHAMVCWYPWTTFGPYNAEAAPRTTSILARSILDSPDCCVKKVPAAGVDKNL